MSHEPSPCGQCGRKDCPTCFPLPARREVPWAGELRLEVDRQMRALQAKEKAAVRDAVLEEAARVADKADRDCATQEWTAETIRALKATPAPITPSAVDEAERRGAERERARVLLVLDSEARYQAALNSDYADCACEVLARLRGKLMFDIPPATESEAGRG